MRAQTRENTIAVAQSAKVLDQRRLSRYSPIRSSQQEFILETQGSEFSVGTKRSGSKDSSVRSSAPQRLDADAIRKVLTDLGYLGQPLSVILHPPCVCLKVVPIDTGNPDAWLAAHLADISPPVNRRELVMSYQYTSSHQLLVAFVRRTFLIELSGLIQTTRISVGGIYVGGAISFLKDIERGPANTCTSLDYSHCRYRLQQNGKDCEVFTDLGVKLPLDQDCLTAEPDLSLKHLNSQRINFSGQAGLPKTLSVSSLVRVVRAESYAVMLCVCLLLLYWGARVISPDPTSDSEYQLAASELGSLRQENASLQSDLERTSRVAPPSYAASTLLKHVATATPLQSVLSSISFSKTRDAKATAFSLSGYSRNSSDPLSFADSLRRYPRITAVTLTRVGLVESPAGDLGRGEPGARWTKFEIVGEYAGR